MTKSAAFGGKWENINQALIAQCDISGKELVLFLGEQSQKVEIANVRLTSYGPDFDMSKFPGQKESYEGCEPDADWRKDWSPTPAAHGSEIVDKLDSHLK